MADWVITDIFTAEYWLLLAGFLAFTIGYHALTRGAWRRTTAGRILMSLGASCSVIMLQVIFRLIFRNAEWRIYVAMVSNGVLVGVVIWLNVYLWRRQLRVRGERENADDRVTRDA